MRWEDIKTGGKLWYVRKLDSHGSRSSKGPRYVSAPVYVMQKQEAGWRILASIGGAPAKWYEKVNWARWKTEPQNQ